ncbi:WYL domain-containing protein [Vibrio splendidus]
MIIELVIATFAAVSLVCYWYKKTLFRKKLANTKYWQKLVASTKMSVDKQQTLCEKFDLPHQVGSRTYDSVEDWENELTIVWTGETADIEFTYRKYDDRERRAITPKEFGFDGNKKAYLRGICHTSKEPRTFKTCRIETKIKVGSKRYDIDEWITSFLEVDLTQISPKITL